MKIKKLCEYFNEIGILEYENINDFLEIYSKLNNKSYSRSIDKLRDTLVIYLNNNFIKKNELSQLCENILLSYNNYQLILKYRILNNMKNILMNKITSKYILFFLNISLYIQNKNNRVKKNLSRKNSKSTKKRIQKPKGNYEDNNDINNNKLNEEKEELISSDDERECTFTPQINKNFKGYKKPINNNVESRIYYSPAFNIVSKYPIKNYQNYIPERNNNINMNNINNIQRNYINGLNPDSSYYSNYSNYTNYNNNYNNLNLSNDNRSNRSFNPYENNNNILSQTQNQKFNNEYISKGLTNQYLKKNDYSNNKYYDNNLILNNNYDNEILINYNNPNIRNFYSNNFSNSSIINNNRNDDFFNKEMNHIQKVKDKIQNMKIEKMNKIKEECTFEPKINTNYKGFYPQNKQKENIIYSQTQPQQQPQNKPSISYKVIQKQKNLNYDQKIIRPKEALDTIKEKENINQNSFVEQKKIGKKKRPNSEKKKGLKIMEDLSLAKKRRTEKTKKLLKERNFTPKVKKNDKYKITMTFEERRLKSIALKNKYKNAKKEEKAINPEAILAPGEMVRFKENINDNFNSDFNKFDNSEFDKNKDMNINNIEDGKEINDKLENKDSNALFDNNINKKEIEKNKMLLMDKIKGEHKIGFKAKKEGEENDNKENNEEVFEINKFKMMEKFEDNNKDKELMNKEEKNENDSFIDIDKIENIEKDDEFTFKSSGFHSNALKNLLDKNKKV